MANERTIIVCSWQECPFVADVTSRFTETYGFTPRELEVFELVVDGLDSTTIAERLVISIGTVKAHLHRIYKKAGVSGRVALMRMFSLA